MISSHLRVLNNKPLITMLCAVLMHNFKQFLSDLSFLEKYFIYVPIIPF